MPGYWAYSSASILSRILPRRMAYWLGLRIADAFYFFDGNARRAVASNLQRVYAWRGVALSQEARRGLTRKTFHYFGKYLVDFFRDAHLDRRLVDRRVSLEHADRLAKIYEEGRGVVLVTAHLGNWELGGAVLCALGYPLYAVVAPERLPRLEKLLRHQRERRGISMVEIGRSARALLRRLREGLCVALLTDRDFSGEHTEIEFFGAPAHLPRGAAWLAHRADAPVLPVFLLRMEDDSYLLRVKRPIDPRETRDPAVTHALIRDALQEEIAANPHQWFLFHDFWSSASEWRRGR